MLSKFDLFWEILKAIQNQSSNVTDVIDALAKGDKTKVTSYFETVIDQLAHNTADYQRVREFFIDLFASHRTLTTLSKEISDPHALPNSDLDELFRSMGYPYSSILRGPTENPLEQKVQFFLDLVNLYKIKGTPQALVEVLQYYGVTDLDVFEYLLKLNQQGDLEFEGIPVAGTTINQSRHRFAYDTIVDSDPHWLYTIQQILQLNSTNKINLPSKTPYIGVMPAVDIDGPEMSLLVRQVQDQYFNVWKPWYDAGAIGNFPLPENAEFSYLGETHSLLELYLSSVYMFNKLHDAGAPANPISESCYSSPSGNFVCYDGTNIITTDILDEYNSLAKAPSTREELVAQLCQYYDRFSREVPRNFLQTETDAGTILNLVDPQLKSLIDTSIADEDELLISLIRDLANWVRSNIGFGFINFGFVLPGIKAFFDELGDVIEFFKPYRARILLLEVLQIRERLFNSIIIEDKFGDIRADFEFHDFITGNSIPCCRDLPIDSTDTLTICADTGDVITNDRCHREFLITPVGTTWKGIWENDVYYAVNDVIASWDGVHYICIQAHTSFQQAKPDTGSDWTLYWQPYSNMVCDIDSTGVTYYSRETYDCGSYHDIGAVTDISRNVFIEYHDSYYDGLRCPRDGTAFVVSEILETSQTAIAGSDSATIETRISIPFDIPQSNTNYSIGYSVINTIDAVPSLYSSLITNKTTSGFEVTLSGVTDSTNYSIDWTIEDGDNSGQESIPFGATEVSVTFTTPQASDTYSLSTRLVNTIDSTSSIYTYIITEKTTSGFKVLFSGLIDSSNYVLDWFVVDVEAEGIESSLPSGSNEVDVTFATPQDSTNYQIIAHLVNTDDTSVSIYETIVTEKTTSGFTVRFSGNLTTGNYKLLWFVPAGAEEITFYRQTSGFRDYDSDGTFDCTHGFDSVEITIEGGLGDLGFILQENGQKILQETGYGLFIE